MNLYATISVYKSSKDSSVGQSMSLAEFMAMGKDYAPTIMAYRTLKQSVREAKAQREQNAREIEDALLLIANPMYEEDSAEYQSLLKQKEELRSRQRELDECIERGEAECDRMKRSLPAATLSGYFAGKRSVDTLTQHSGFICIDIDDHVVHRNQRGEKESVAQDISRVPEILAQLPWVLYAAHSVGGQGYFAIVPLGPIDAVHTHKWYFECLEQEFLQLGLVIDHACSDVSRLRILSYDKEPYRNAHATEYMGIAKFVGKAEKKRIEEEQHRLALAEQYRALLHKDPSNVLRDVESCVDQIERRHLDITEDYDQCVKLGRAFLSLGDAGLFLWKRVCAFRSATHSQMRTPEQCEEKWKSLQKTGSIDIGYFFNLLKDPKKGYNIYARHANCR